jgi:hypothetical protein
VAKYYAVKHEEIFSGSKDGFLPLEHKPGEIQVDFGAAGFYENGLHISGKYLGVSYPYTITSLHNIYIIKFLANMVERW